MSKVKNYKRRVNISKIITGLTSLISFISILVILSNSKYNSNTETFTAYWTKTCVSVTVLFLLFILSTVFHSFLSDIKTNRR